MAQGTVGVAPSTTTITLADGTTIALADWIDDQIYGTVQLASGTQNPVDAFSAGRSQAVPGGGRVQTKVDTNVPKAADNGLPKDWEMLIYAFGIMGVRAMRVTGAAQNPTLADYSNPLRLATMFDIDRKTFVQFEYNDKKYTQGVTQDYPQGHGYSVFATTTSFEVAQNGVTSPRDRRSMVLPVHMREGLGYKMSFEPAAGYVFSQPASDQGAPLLFADYKIYLYGLIKRTVV